MRCNICDAVLAEPQYNSDLKAYEPCVKCLEVIMDAVGTYKDRPFADDDELGGDPDTGRYVGIPPEDRDDYYASI